MSKNAYAQKLKDKQQARDYIVKQWTAQLCLDIMTDVLNDPAVMGKDTMGAIRLERIGKAFNERFPIFFTALAKDPESDYMRAKIDEQQKRIFGDKALAWAERYEYWAKEKYCPDDKDALLHN